MHKSDKICNKLSNNDDEEEEGS